MELAKYLETEGLTLAEFGKRIGLGVEGSTVARWRDGALFPSPRNMELIKAATDGQVTYRDFQRTRDKVNAQ